MATRIRQKAEKRAKQKDIRPFAKARYIRMSPSKVRIVLDLIRGKNAKEAAAILANMPNAAAEASLKVLNSAIANAENNKGMNGDNLFVAEAYVCQGPILKRITQRGKGSADRILKKTSHITIVLDEKR